jgi:hypothetical protein
MSAARNEVVNPDEIPPSPSLSALQRLSFLENPPSAPSSEARSTPPMSPLGAMPPYEAMPDIPDIGSVLSRQIKQGAGARTGPIAAPAPPPAPAPAPEPQPVLQPILSFSPGVEPKSFSPTPSELSAGPTPKPSRSKLSALASSRTSTYTASSRSGTIETSSVVTYPALRPAAESFLSLRPESVLSSSTADKSDTSSVVRRAIATAMGQEEDDAKTATPEKTLRSHNTGSTSTVKLERRSTTGSQARESVAGSGAGLQGSKPPLSKLAMLAQSKAAQQKGPWMPTPKTQPPRKDATPSELLHKTHTEYLTPIANGPTATTAITTSYQSLANLTPPSRSGLPPPAIEPIPTVQLGHPALDGSGKPSKLASKAKRSSSQRHHKHGSVDTSVKDDEDAYYPPPELPVFLPRSTSSKRSSRASPSAFASLLVNDVSPLQGSGKESRTSRSDSRRSRTTDGTPKQRPTSKPLPPLPSLSAVGSFTFDVPSPDDIVYEARKGTALASRDSQRSSHHHTPSTTSLRSSVKSSR